MIRKGTSDYGRRFAKPKTALSICVLTSSLLLLGVCNAQSSAFPIDERLTVSGAEPKSEQQRLADLFSAREALDSQPSAQGNLSLGRALNALGETEAASKTFDRALELNPKLAEAWFEKASIIADHGDWSKAGDLFRYALAASPDYPSAHLGLGEMLLRVGDFEDSANELQTALRLDPRSAGAHQGLGLIYLQEGKLDLAADEFRRALAIRPGYLDALRGLARTLAYQHKWIEAAALLKQLVAANHPPSAEEAFSLGTALANIGDKPGAERQFVRARELSSRQLVLLRAKGESNWGIALRNEGQLQDAAAAFRRALGDDPSYCEAHDDLGEIGWLQKDFAGALSEFQIAVRCSPESALARNNLGFTLLSYRHDIDSAIEQFRAALASRPGFALAHFNLGKALAAKQDLTGAEPELRRALAINPDLAAAHVDLGLLLAMRKGNIYAEARSEMETGLRLDPSLRVMIPQQYLAQLH
ncbi:MAG TPA: tetratricopeptide repeat protein [Candidatus Sulfotelmatobacter sp.]